MNQMIKFNLLHHVFLINKNITEDSIFQLHMIKLLAVDSDERSAQQTCKNESADASAK